MEVGYFFSPERKKKSYFKILSCFVSKTQNTCPAGREKMRVNVTTLALSLFS